MKKKLILAGMVLVGLFTMVGCGSGGNAGAGSAEIQYADEAFMQDLQKGLQARWDLNDDIANGTTEYSSEQEERKDCVDAELDVIENYTSQTFEDSRLQETAIAYINALKDQKESLDYYNVDYDKYTSMWAEAYNERSELLYSFVNDFGLTVDESYQHWIDEFMTNASLVKHNKQIKKAMKKMAKNAKFKLVEDNYGWKKYKAIVKNKTGVDLKNVSFQINLLDEDGIIVYSTSAYVNNFKTDQKAKLEFDTDETFESTEVTVDYWEEAE